MEFHGIPWDPMGIIRWLDEEFTVGSPAEDTPGSPVEGYTKGVP